MKKLIVALCLSVVMAGFPVMSYATDAPAQQTRKTGKRTNSKPTVRTIATVNAHGETYKMLSNGKLKCVSNPNYAGTYVSHSGRAGYSVNSPIVEWYDVCLYYIPGDGGSFCLIFKDGENDNKIYEYGQGTDIEAEVDPIGSQVTILDLQEDEKETKNISDLEQVGTVKWTGRK